MVVMGISQELYAIPSNVVVFLDMGPFNKQKLTFKLGRALDAQCDLGMAYTFRGAQCTFFPRTGTS
jgi:hypothetical protein